VYVHGTTKPNEKEIIMGLFDLFKASSKTVLVVDGVSLNNALGMKGNVPPRNQLQLLRRLSRFSEREKIGVIVILAGSPLHKAPAGKKFEEITVLYSKSTEAHPQNIAKIAAAKGSGSILISSNPAVEKIALGRGMKTMRISTFRKAFDTGGNDPDNNNRSERNSNERGGNNNRNRSQQRRRPQQKQQPKKQTTSEKKPPRPPKDNSQSDAINELIDLID
jgi:hypothetical protein